MSIPDFNTPVTELLDGKIFNMSPRPATNHTIVSANIFRIFGNYLESNTCQAFSDGHDVFLGENDRIVPDMMVICNPSIIKGDGIYGAPNLIVEVLSPSTAKNDRGYKMQLYARFGIGEYWIVDPINKTIEIYLLTDGVYSIEAVYSIYPDYVIKKMSAEEREQELISEFQSKLFPDLTIRLDDVFAKMIPAENL